MAELFITSCPKPMRIQDAIEKLKGGASLSRSEAASVMVSLLSGSAPDNEIAALLVALRDKGESSGELAGFAEVMRARAREVLEAAGVRADQLAGGQPLLDTCGTGGDSLGTFNVSTATAFVAAAAGARVAKHGNRSISSRCGSADVLEALGVAIELPLGRIPECLDRVGMVFLFAPQLHLATQRVMAARRRLKTRTIFNLLGPLTNPLGASRQLAGVYEAARTEMMAQALGTMGAERAFVVNAHDGMDEISISGQTTISETAGTEVCTREAEPEEFGVTRARADAVGGGDVAMNARIARDILDGKPGERREMVVANASAAIVAAGLAADFLEGAERAREAIDSGRAKGTLEVLRQFTQTHSR
ncbi:MAG: anthranilate phosphoribosyltransferase [Terriglobia bacterium]